MHESVSFSMYVLPSLCNVLALASCVKCHSPIVAECLGCDADFYSAFLLAMML